MEVEDVLADKVIQLGLRICLPVVVEIDAVFFAQVFERPHVADRGVEPDIKVFAGRLGNFKAEVRRIARNVPVTEPVFAFCAQPFLHLVGGFRLQMAAVVRPAAQEILAARIGKLEEIMLGLAQLRRGAGNSRVGVFQFIRRVGSAARLAVVAILVGGAAFRAFAFNEAVGQKHLPGRVVILFDRARCDQAVFPQTGVNQVGVVAGFRRMRRVEIVKADVEAGKIAEMLIMHARDQRLRRDAFLLGAQHDWRAVRIVGADVPARRYPVFRLHFLEAHPDIGLDIFDKMAEMDRAVGVRQGGSDENFAGHDGMQGILRNWQAVIL